MKDSPLVNIKRTYFEDATVGFLWVDGYENPVWSTIELPWKDNQRNISCIPEGTYIVKPFRTERSSYYPNIWQVCDVIGRDDIQIHVANVCSELKGCIAMGLSSGYMFEQDKNVKAVTSSAMAMNEMKNVIDYSKPFKLKIWS